MALEIERKVKNAVLYTNGTIRLDNVRMSYPHCGHPYKGSDDKADAKASYGLVALLPKDTHGEAKDLCVEIMNKILAEKKTKVASDKKFLRNGDNAGKDEYEGHYTVSANETRRPTIRNRKNEVVVGDEAEELIYPGSYAHILIRPWWQDNAWGKRINAGLVAVKFAADGERFGEGTVDDAEAWDDDEHSEHGWDGADTEEDDDDL